MPSVLSDHDKETVKRVVPRSSNKIQAVAVARLYVVLPGQSRWTYTGLQGAAVLSNDLVGNTIWVKLVDISPSNRGVIWDQEIYDTFQYNQDRTFFHSFELEQCMAGLSFVDEKEAKQFKKKMDEREKNASKATKSTPFGRTAGGVQAAQANGGGHKSHGLLGGLFGRHRNTSNPPAPAPQMPAPHPVYSSVPTGIGGSRPQSSGPIDLSDPTWRPIIDELFAMGITEDQISENADFIRDYIGKKQAEEMANGIASALPQAGHGRAPPPPPPPGGPAAQRLTPDNTGTSLSGRRGPPPAPPPSRRPVPGRAPSPPRPVTPERTPSPPTTPQLSQHRYRAPPPLADAGKFAVKEGPALHPSAGASGRPRASSGAALANPGPPPPPRPPKEADEDAPSPGFRVPPPFSGQRQSSAPPPPPSRGPVPPPPPSRDVQAPFPPPPPSRGLVPPPPPSRANAAPIPPPLPPSNTRSVPPPPSSAGLPPPPPPMPSFGGAPPPPPPPPPGGSGGPPPPPLPPANANAPPLPKAGGGGRDDLLASIRAAGGGGAGGLRKVKDSEKRDRSAAAIPGSEGSAPPPLPGGGGGGAPSGDAGGLAGALQAALNQRKKKVAHSDDEKDDDDDW